ncbi:MULTISPECIES: RadC family protein [Hydrocarboniphaga]|jgi:DNA repair protein RadC|uniref:DNA repair protein RadC n=1 Tax=Hydrocarboniphaga effusa AP103 TaxID=1172194 RepID=I7ZB19_9GAMM|nr:MULTISPECIES: DNA repair protein RadC [Hydrocarboniphaga]EIT68862.1 DNA repair protein RadC [Hydrocarboniphaga effusa AP103]MDZ4077718.1 DNA repair protein RadC [Hydrocarboniphaga sp.]
MSIRDWPASDRPREKLLMRGAAILTDAELLAIFLRTGLPGRSAVDLARELLTRFGSLRALLAASQREFCSAHGLGQAKYAQLQAVLEMGRRHLDEDLRERDSLSDPSAVRRYLQARLRGLDHEVFAALFLDSQHRLIAYEAITHGTIDGASIYPREVVKAALRLGAAAIIFAHNHPSGIAEPSAADRILTDRLREALRLVDVRVLDHFVVGEGRPVSFAERGWL